MATLKKLTKHQLLEFKSPKSMKYLVDLFKGDNWDAHHELSRLIATNVLVGNSDNSFILKDFKNRYELFLEFRKSKLKAISALRDKKYKERWRFGSSANKGECKITEKLIKEIEVLDEQSKLLWNVIDLTPGEFMERLDTSYKLK